MANIIPQLLFYKDGFNIELNTVVDELLNTEKATKKK